MTDEIAMKSPKDVKILLYNIQTNEELKNLLEELKNRIKIDRNSMGFEMGLTGIDGNMTKACVIIQAVPQKSKMDFIAKG